MSYPILAPRDTWWKSSVLRNTITSLSIVDSYTPTGSEEEVWNADVGDTGSIKCYRTGTEAILAGDGSGKIALNEDSTSVFGACTKEDLNGLISEGFSSVTSIEGLELCDTSNVTTFTNAFSRCAKVTHLAISDWDVSNVTSMAAMFNGCSSLAELPINGWNVGKVESFYRFLNMRNTTYQNKDLTSLDFSNWDTSSCIQLSQFCTFFVGLTSINISNWDTSKAVDMSYMFYHNTGLTEIVGISELDTSSCSNMSCMFYHCISLTELDLSKWDVSKVTTFQRMFASVTGSTGYEQNGSLRILNVSNWDVSSCTSMRSMFSGQRHLTSIAVETWTNTSACKDMGWMFWGTMGLKSLDISKWNTSNVESFHHFLAHSNVRKIIGIEDINLSSCKTIRCMLDDNYLEGVLDVSKWDVSNVEDFVAAFSSMYNLTGFKGLENWNTSKGKSFVRTFQNIPNLTYLDLSGFDTRNATVDWDDPYASSTSMNYGMKWFVSTLPSLQKIKIGENVSFNGCGDCTGDNAAVLPTPNSDYIPETRGVWYNADTLESYEAADIPNQTAATYVCTPVDVLIKHTTLSDFADVTRKMTGTSDKMSPADTVVALNDAVVNNTLFEAGKQAEYDAFWDSLQENGSRYDYRATFGAGWNDNNFKPKYDIEMGYCERAFQNTHITDLKGIMERQGVKFVWELEANNYAMVFYATCITHLPVIDFTTTTGSSPINLVFINSNRLVSIEKFVVKADGSQTFGTAVFQGCSALTDIVVEGQIGSSITFNWSPLSVKSMKSIISCLKDYSGTENAGKYTIQFNSDCWANLEKDSAAPDGGTWKEYVSYTLGWAT